MEKIIENFSKDLSVDELIAQSILIIIILVLLLISIVLLQSEIRNYIYFRKKIYTVAETAELQRNTFGKINIEEI